MKRFWFAFDLARYVTLVVLGLVLLAAGGLWPWLSS